jgi:hypothetical protein
MGFTGQVTALLGVPLCFAYRDLRRGDSLRGGLLAGVVLSIKPILWPLALWHVVRGAWSALAGMMAGAAAAVAVGLAFYGTDVYRAWILALGRLGGEAARKPLLAMLQADRSAKARVAAARALGRLGGAGDALARAAKDPDEMVREAVKWALAPSRADPALNSWIHIYWTDEDGAPLRHERYLVVDASGLVRAGYTDSRGESSEEQFPQGTWAYELLDERGNEQPLAP